MRWQGRRESNNIEDRRGMSAGGGSGGGAGLLLRVLPMLFRVLGFKGAAIVVLGLGAFGVLSGNLGNMLAFVGIGQPVQQASQPVRQSGAERELVSFVSVVLADTEETWGTLFQQMGKRYQEPRLVLFRNAVKSACGMAQSATGPFYCPADQKVYLDLGFFDELGNRFKAPGDFAQAYVIAHEVGHHVQTLLGISKKVHAARAKLNETQGNQLSVKQELQADCLAGVWAHHAGRARNLLETGDVEEGLQAASAIGDDTLQRQSKGYVTPDSFTHGSSAQRVQWFKTGLAKGELSACNTFGG